MFQRDISGKVVSEKINFPSKINEILISQHPVISYDNQYLVMRIIIDKAMGLRYSALHY